MTTPLVQIAYRYPAKKEKRVTFAFVRDETLNQIRVGVAFCGPRDQFVKRIGQSISTGRLQREMAQSSDFDLWGQRTSFTVTYDFIQQCIGTSEVPTTKQVVEFLRNNVKLLTGIKP